MLRTFSSQITAAIISIILLLGVGTFTFHKLEDWSWVDSFYFTTATATTVGYGDLSPTTDTSKIIASMFMLTGTAGVVAALGVIGTGYLNRRSQKVVENRLRHILHQDKKAK